MLKLKQVKLSGFGNFDLRDKSQRPGRNPKTGEEIWKSDRRPSKDNYGAPTLFREKSGKLQAIYVSITDGFQGIDPMTGKQIWQHNPGYSHRSVGGVVLGEGMVFGTLGSGSGGKACAALIPGTIERPVQVAYEFEEAIPYVPTPIIHDERMYLLLDSGMFSCVEAKTGKMIYDRERLSTGRSASPGLAGNKIVCCSHGGDVVVVETGDEFKVLGRSNLGELINACPAVVGNQLFLRTTKHLYCIGE